MLICIVPGHIDTFNFPAAEEGGKSAPGDAEMFGQAACNLHKWAVWKAHAHWINILVDLTDDIDCNHITVAGTPFAGFPAEKFLIFTVPTALCVLKVSLNSVKKCAA